jgi:dihydroorotase-like cyclic amidohydrolase
LPELLIVNGRLLDPERRIDRTADLLIRDGKIAAIANPGSLAGADARRIDAAGLVVAPGFLDMHTHLREPGTEEVRARTRHRASPPATRQGQRRRALSRVGEPARRCL